MGADFWKRECESCDAARMATVEERNSLRDRIATLEAELAQLKQRLAEAHRFECAFRDQLAAISHTLEMPGAPDLTTAVAPAVERAIAQLKQPASVLAEAERLLREASVRDFRLHLDEVWARASVWYSGSSPDVICKTLAEAYAKLTGGR